MALNGRHFLATDAIRPDWQIKLRAKEDAEAERQRRVQRLNNRLQQLQLAPEGRSSISSSNATERSPSPSTRSPIAHRPYDQLAAQQVASMRGADGAFGYLATLTGPELEEMLLQEAMRMSLHDDDPTLESHNV